MASTIQNLFIAKVGLIFSDFKTFIDQIKALPFFALFNREMYEVCRSFNQKNWFVRSSRSLLKAKHGKLNVLPHVFAVHGVVCETAKILGMRIPRNLEWTRIVLPQLSKSCNAYELAEKGYTLQKQETTKDNKKWSNFTSYKMLAVDRVIFPSKFSSLKMCCNIAKSSIKVGHKS